MAGGGSRSYAAAGKTANVRSSSMSDANLLAAETAIAVFRGRPGSRLRPGTRLKKLTFLLNESALRRAKPYWILTDDDVAADLDHRVGELALAHPAAAELEELRLNCTRHDRRYRPRLESFPCAATLRVLELNCCNLEPPTPSKGRLAMALPRLTDLQLAGCVISEGFLQVVVDAAPTLNKLALVNVHHKVGVETDAWGSVVPDYRLRLQLRCRTVTALALDTSECRSSSLDESGIQLDMPSLRSFSYRGFRLKLSLTSPAHELELVDLYVPYSSTDNRVEPVSRMLRSFCTTRALKLRLSCIEDILAGEDDEEDGGAILPTFPNLELLELHGQYEHKNHRTPLAMARLLGSCPVMSELRLGLKMIWDDRSYYFKSRKDTPAGGAFRVSMDRFNRLASRAYLQGSCNNGVEHHREISDLPALSGCTTLGCLRKVTLKFEYRELNCLPVQLAKFLVENAMALQEMRVDDGSHFWSDHLYNNVARWRADSLRRRNLPPDTGDFHVYYLPIPTGITNYTDDRNPSAYTQWPSV